MKASHHHLVIGALVLGATTLFSAAGFADGSTESPQAVYAGRAGVYKDLDRGSLEDVSTPDRIKAVTAGNVAPTQIWQVLEHGERVECLDCIPMVGKLLYDPSTTTREISAWWLRRRIFGVFGPGQVYQQTIQTLQDQSQPETKRAYAAQALGEFLAGAGVPVVATAAINDPSAMVRTAAVKALKRLNNQGPNGELGQAMSDPDENVRLAALDASTRVNVFTDVPAVVKLISDSSPLVRRGAAQALGTMRATDAVAGLAALADPGNEPDADVRISAVAALGEIGDSAGRSAVQAAQNDPNSLVRDAATIALRRL